MCEGRVGGGKVTGKPGQGTSMWVWNKGQIWGGYRGGGGETGDRTQDRCVWWEWKWNWGGRGSGGRREDTLKRQCKGLGEKVQGVQGGAGWCRGAPHFQEERKGRVCVRERPCVCARYLLVLLLRLPLATFGKTQAPAMHPTLEATRCVQVCAGKAEAEAQPHSRTAAQPHTTTRARH